MKTRVSCPFRWLGSLLGGLVGLTCLQAQQPPQFTRIQSLTNREIRLELSATAGSRYRIDTSVQLGPWAPLVTLAGATSLQHTDSAAPFLPGRFYRAEELPGINEMTGDHLVTSEGDVVIHPVNHASLILSWNGTTIYVDPGDSASRFTGLPRADLILLTHEHSDHYFSNTVNTVKGSNAVILATSAVYDAMPSNLKALTTVLSNGATTNFLTMTIDAVPAYNLTSSHHPQGRGNGYVLTLGGRRIYISGDTEDIPEMRALSDIDVAFVCMNLPYTMTISQAVSAVREFQPKVVYPYHYSLTANATGFKSQLGTDLGIEVRLRKWY
jgi:L-ascorbate metabolism protein UlaG (beta-lactamase superfamily)